MHWADRHWLALFVVSSSRLLSTSCFTLCDGSEEKTSPSSEAPSTEEAEIRDDVNCSVSHDDRTTLASTGIQLTLMLSTLYGTSHVEFLSTWKIYVLNAHG